MLDLLIKGGRVVTPTGVGEWDIGVQGEKIVAVAESGSISAEGGRTIDATGKIVVPGGIEAHAHIGFGGVAAARNPISRNNAGPAEQSLAALWGGTTTVVDFAGMPDDGGLVEAIHNHLNGWKDRAYTDYTAHAILRGTATPNAIGQIKDLIAAGFPSVKVFTTSLLPPTPDRPSMKMDMGRLEAIMNETSRYGGVVAVHAEDDDIVQYNYARAQEQGRMDWWNMHLIHSNLSEDLSFRRVIRVAEKTGAAIYFVHTSAREGVNAIAEARRKGLPVYGETLNTYCSFNVDNYKEHDGMKYHTYPSVKFEDDRRRLWDGLIRGDLSFMATDSIATSFADKVAGRTILDVTGGNIGIEIRMGITYKEGVIDQGASLERYAAITSTNVAKVLGFYPRKGVIAAGSDADITLIDPSIRKKLEMRDLHISDYSSWTGRDISGWPTTVVLRGKVMIDGRKLVGKPTDGKLIPRKVPSQVLKGPWC
jgi:dihydropyrimidinase